jgi:vacuolar-type H+-ATPase subunit H
MIQRNALIIAAIVAVGGLTACERSAEQERERVQAAQREADQKVDQAKKESTTRITSAQTEVDKIVAEANANFAKTRDEYRDKLTKDVREFDQKIDRLERRSATTTGQTKNELDSALPDIRARRQALQTDMAQLDAATMGNWDALKNRLDTDRQALTSAIDKAPMAPVVPSGRTPIMP